MKYSRAHGCAQSRSSGWRLVRARGSPYRGHLCHCHGAAGAEVEVSLTRRVRRAPAGCCTRQIEKELPAAARLKILRSMNPGLRIPGAFFSDLNIEPLDLLVQRGKRNVEALRGIGLVPVALLQHAHDEAALAILNDLK